MIYIAIDPGIVNGFVCINTKARTRFMKGLSFWQCIAKINEYKSFCIKHGGDIKVFVEDPNYNKSLYAKRFTDDKNMRTLLHTAQNIGMNKQMATLIIDYCKVTGLPVEALTPFKGGKVPGPAFEQQTGIVTNQHCRDAYMILVRKNVIPYNKQQFYNI